MTFNRTGLQVSFRAAIGEKQLVIFALCLRRSDSVRPSVFDRAIKGIEIEDIEVRVAQLLTRVHQNVAIVALANKLLRMAWAVLCKNEVYRSPVLPTSS